MKILARPGNDLPVALVPFSRFCESMTPFRVAFSFFWSSVLPLVCNLHYGHFLESKMHLYLAKLFAHFLFLRFISFSRVLRTYSCLILQIMVLLPQPNGFSTPIVYKNSIQDTRRKTKKRSLNFLIAFDAGVIGRIFLRPAADQEWSK